MASGTGAVCRGSLRRAKNSVSYQLDVRVKHSNLMGPNVHRSHVTLTRTVSHTRDGWFLAQKVLRPRVHLAYCIYTVQCSPYTVWINEQCTGEIGSKPRATTSTPHTPCEDATAARGHFSITPTATLVRERGRIRRVALPTRCRSPALAGAIRSARRAACRRTRPAASACSPYGSRRASAARGSSRR